MKQIFIFLVVLLPFLAKSQTVIYGKYKYTDSLTFAKYKNSSTLDSVLSVDQNGRLRLAPASGLDTTSLSNRIDARVKYTDTSSMLIPYLRKLDTTGKWLAVGYLPYLVKYTDTAAFLSAYYNKTVIDSKLALKLNISDTAAMLSPYARTANLPSLAPYVKYTDTSTMLSPYYRTATATAALALKLNISDTATMLSSYYNKTTVDSKVNLKVNISDTLSMLSPYQRSFLAVKYTDTASMLSNYRTNINSLISDSVYQAAQILLRVRYTDTSTMLSPYARTLSLGGYVPYSGATNDLNIGTHNLYANNFFDGFTNIAASGTQIVLTTASTPSYTITGSGGQTIKLPDATTLPNGAIFYFNNNQTTGAITINNNSNTLIISIPSGGFAEVYLLDNSIAAGSWDRHFQAPSNVSWSTNTFDYAGSITSATWNGVAVAVNRGGTGASTSGGALTNLGAQPQLNGTGFVKASGTTISYDNSTYLTTSSASSTYLPLGGGTMTGNLILNADPTNSLGAVTKNYVDNAITGIFWKSAVKAATTGNITLLGAQTIDGVSIVANDRVLVKNQSTATQNGIYLASTTIWTRTTDADTGGEIYGSAVFVENGGSINGGTQWTNSNTSQPTIGVDNISFSQIAGAGVYTAGTYLSLTGNVFDVNSTYSSNWNNKINPSDTATMLTPYLRSVNYGLIKSSQTVSADSSLLSTKLWRQKGIDSVAALDALKVKYTDTATMLSAYYNKTATDAKVNLKVNISDTATMLSAYYNKTATDSKFALKVNISDTAAMLSGYKTYYPRAALSFTAGSGAYNNSTGVITIPTNTNQLTNGAGFISSYTETDPIVKAINGIVKSNGTTISAASAGTDYQAPISLTTTGSSGASTFSSNTLNVPNYTLSGLGGQPQLNGTGFVKATGTTISYDNSTYLTGNQTITLSGDISGSGATAITTTIGALKVTNGMLAGTINYSKMDATTVPTWNQSTTGTAANITATSNATLTTLSALSLPYSQLTGTPTLSYLPLAGGIMTGQIVIKQSSSSTDYTNGIKFPDNAFGGGGDIAGLRLYASSGENQVLEMYVGNDATDIINFATGVGGTANNNAVTINGNIIYNAANSNTITSLGTIGTGVWNGSAISDTYISSASTWNAKIGGSGTPNYLPKFTGTSTIGNSQVFDDGAVGISNTTPSSYYNSQLVVGNDAAGYGSMTMATTSTGINSIFFSRSSSGAGRYRGSISYVQSTDAINFRNSGDLLRMTLDASGNLGLGVTPSAWGSPFNVFEGGGSSTQSFIAFQSNVSALKLGTNNYYSAGNYLYRFNGSATRFDINDGNFVWNQAPSGTAGNAITFTQAMTLTASGRLLINKTNEETYQLDVNGTGRFSSSALVLTNTNSYAALNIGDGTRSSYFGYAYSASHYTNNSQAGDAIIRAYNGITLQGADGGGGYFRLASTGAATFSSSVTSTYNVVNSGTSDATFLAQTTGLYSYLTLQKDNAVSTIKRWDVMYRGDTYFGNTSNALIFLGEHANLAGTIDGYYMPLALQPTGNVIMCAGSNVLGNGNVGIGTSSPTSIGGYTILSINNASNSGLLDIQNNGTSVAWLYGSSSAAVLQAVGTTTSLTFQTNSAERMRITSGGVLQVANGSGTLGTIVGSERLNVNGDVYAYGSIVASGGVTSGGTTTQSYGYGLIFKGYTGSYYDVMFLNSGLAVDELQVSGGLNMVTTTAGFTVPNMTTTQKNALTKRKGMIVYDTTINLLQAWNGSAWNNLW